MINEEKSLKEKRPIYILLIYIYDMQPYTWEYAACICMRTCMFTRRERERERERERRFRSFIHTKSKFGASRSKGVDICCSTR